MFYLVKKQDLKQAVYLKNLIGESVKQEDVKTCIIVALQAYNQKVVEFNLEPNFALIKIDNSIFDEGIISKKPVCLPLGGSLAGMMEVFTNASWDPKEIECKACGGEYFIFELKRKKLSDRFLKRGKRLIYAQKK